MSLPGLPEKYADLIEDDARAFAYLTTLMRDGTPQTTPVWFNTDGEHILINSARGRVKDRNMRARPDVVVVIHLQDDPYRYIQIRGKVVEITEQGAREHINQLSAKYTGNPHYKLNAPDEIRVTYKLSPGRIQAQG